MNKKEEKNESLKILNVLKDKLSDPDVLGIYAVSTTLLFHEGYYDLVCRCRYLTPSNYHSIISSFAKEKIYLHQAYPIKTQGLVRMIFKNTKPKIVRVEAGLFESPKRQKPTKITTKPQSKN